MEMKPRAIAGLSASLFLAGGLTAHAATITQLTNTGTVYTTSGLTGFQTDGDEMDGMTVTATWITSSGVATSSTQSWADTGSNSGGVEFVDNSDLPDFRLRVSGDTFDSNNWDLRFVLQGSQVRLLSLVFDGTTGRTVFDLCGANNQFCTNSPYGTSGSADGRNFSGFADFGGNITATYFNAVAVGAAAPVGDIFAGFRLDFGNGTFSNGLGENDCGYGVFSGWRCEEYNFTLDTDNATTKLVVQVPVPGTLLALSAGLIALGAVRRRQR
jgi:hypothetical protein